MRWRLICGGIGLALTACGVLPSSAPEPTAVATPPPPTAAPTASRASVPPSASPAPKPTNTPEPEQASSDKVWVGNTDGEGVYIRKTPVMADRLRPYPDGTELTIIGDDVDGDGQHWKNVRTPDGLEGYVPSMYTTDTPP